MHVVFVCTGNICRSAFAERYAASLARRHNTDHVFSSVGVGAVIGAPMEELMAQRLVEHGGDASNFVARQMDFSSVADADLILPLESHHRRIVIEDYPALHKKTFVLRTAARAAEQAPADVDRLAHVLSTRPQRRPGDSIADPYRRGPVAADKATAQIVEAVDTLFGPRKR